MGEEMGEERQKDIVIWSSKFNSGTFRVPWGETEGLIEEGFVNLAWKMVRDAAASC
jgi:hypothetical protein